MADDHRRMTDGGSHEPLHSERVTFTSAGTRCLADLYRPPTGDLPWPTVVMAHVFGANRRWGLGRFADRFAAAGIAAIPFDYRCFGDSDGTPRRLVDPDRQLADWAAVLDHVRGLAVVDDTRLAVWGSSFSGGHVLEIARRDPGVQAAIAQVPFVDGRATVAHQIADRTHRSRVRMLGRAVADRLLGVLGGGPVEIPIVTDPGQGGLIDSPGANHGFSALAEDWDLADNRTPARVVLALPFYRPGTHAADIEVPVHVTVAEEDRLLPHDPTERTIAALAAPSVHRVPVAHFDVHRDPWVESVATEQVTFLRETLG
ncbi:MAG: alpha/beta hydrolase [Halobacteriaceae archaeon]